MTPNTVFVIGAGASKEAKLPTGKELKARISSLLDFEIDFMDRLTSGDYTVLEAIKHHVYHPERGQGDIKPYIEEALHIRDAMPQALSIDNFIDSQRGNEKLALCGKLAIVKAILEAEKNSLLYFKRDHVDSKTDFKKLEGTWFLPFFQIVIGDCTVNDLEERFRSIALIIFNYDRCIEHFMNYALQNYYRVSDADAAKLIEYIEIYHPYGSVGPLPWQGNSNSTEFGEEIKKGKLLELSNKIKTFTEGISPERSEILGIQQCMSSAKKLVFLGFAFHPMNMQLIKPTKLNDVNVKSYATALRISKDDQRVIMAQINKLYKGNINTHMSDHTCCEFFKEFWRSLSF
jgi:hypothetical protein